LLTVHRDTSVQKEPTGCTIYFQFISIINLYMFRAGLLLIVRRYIQQLVYVMHLCWLVVGRILPTTSQHTPHRLVPPDDEKQDCLKYVEVNYWNKFEVNSASCWFLLYEDNKSNNFSTEDKNTCLIFKVKKLKSVCGSFSTYAFLAGILYSYPNDFLYSSPEALHTRRRERPLSAKEGTISEFS
jgi:hypothetical protein